MAREWLRSNTVPVEPVLGADEQRAREVLYAYADEDFSYVDAASFAVMERLGIGTAFTFDQHFARFGFASLDVDKA